MSLEVKKNKLLFGLLYFVFIFSEQIADDGSVLSNLSNTVDSLKLKYLLAVIIIGVMSLDFLANSSYYSKFRDETRRVIQVVITLLAITIFMQIRNGFLSSSYNEVFFWIIPIVYVFLLINNEEDFEIGSYVNIAFTIQFILFLIEISGKLSVSNILAIDFIGSTSPFESEYSFYGLVFFMYYIYRKDRIRSILSFIMTVLALKRMAVIFAIMIAFINFFPLRNIYYGKPQKIFMNICKAIFIVIPVIFHLLCSNEFSSWFYQVSGMDLNTLISGRLDRLNLCIDNQMLYGLGSTTEFLTTRLNMYASTAYDRNLHNDILRIYLECGIIGTIVFTINYFNICKESTMSMLLMIYLFTDMVFNHFLGAGRVAFWILIYLCIYVFNTCSETIDNEINFHR